MIKKSQITIFIILGIFITIVFLFMIKLKNVAVNETYTEEIEKNLPVELNLDDYFENCVEQKVDYYVDLLLKQGGYIYKSQGGPIEQNLIEIRAVGGGSEKNVILDESLPLPLILNYGILNEIEVSLKVPKNFKKVGSIQGLDTKSGGVNTGLFYPESQQKYFGTNVLPRLCNKDGPNSPEGILSYTCNPLLYNRGGFDRNFTIQSQLNFVLSTEIKKCLDNPEISSFFSIRTEGDGSVSVTFGDEDLSVDSNLTIYYNENQKVKQLNIKYSFPIRLKKIYTLGYLMAEKEIKDIFFDKTKDYKDFYSCNGNCWDSNIEVKLNQKFLKKTESYDFAKNFDDLLVITDRRTQIKNSFNPQPKSKNIFNNGTHLTFMYLVENRRPYLEYIPDLPHPSRPILCVDYGKNPFSKPKRTVYFTIKVLDPDEGDVDEIYSQYSSPSQQSSLKLEQSGEGYYFNPKLSPGTWDIYPNSNNVFPKRDYKTMVDKTMVDKTIVDTFVLSCTNQAKCRSVSCKQNPNYYITRYGFKLEVKDEGGLSDFQKFYLTLSPN